MSIREKFSAELAQWQKTIVTKQLWREKEILHTPAAPVSTDQEAGGAVSTIKGDTREN